MGGNIEAIKERLDIAEVLGGYIKLEKAGVNFKAKCPFHSEKTPSFFISSKRQGYYCFGCGEKGDIFTFVEKMEGVEFKEALRILADKAGVELKYDKGTDKRDNKRLYEALEEATSFFEANLKESKEALKYLESRGVSKESIESWRLGFAKDDWRALRTKLHSLKFSDNELVLTGLVKRSVEHKDKEPYDVFRGRIIFPIFDSKGEPVAFSGRVLSKDVEPKYLNSPDTVLFNKSETLYGFDKAREEIRKKDYSILVEGQLDLVLSHQAGVRNTVASSGTAFTQAHLERLKKLSNRIILAFDGDNAGMKASERSTLLANSLGMEVKIATMPEGSDPADLAKQDPEAWKKVLREAKPAVEAFVTNILSLESNPAKAVKLVEKRVFPLVAVMTSKLDREQAVSKLGSTLGMNPSVLAEMIARIKPDAVRSLSEGVVEESKGVSLEKTLVERIESEIATIEEIQKDLDHDSLDYKLAEKNRKELLSNLSITRLEEERRGLLLELLRVDDKVSLQKKIIDIGKSIDDERRKLL